jgi:NitT/TauT family transport system permease protein
MLEARAQVQLQEELAGLDALELSDRAVTSRGRRIWSATWPKVAAVVIAIALWQLVVWSGWKPDYVLPPPGRVYGALWHQIGDGTILKALRLTMWRAAKGFGLALVLGTVVGALVSRVRVLRVAVGSMITGLQTMPSIAWFPLAVLLFKLSETAILFVLVLGAAPAIANGLISGVDHVPPLLVRAGRVLGAKRLTLFRHVILPAALPSCLAGLKQGWAFAWRSLMAGELLAVSLGRSIGADLQTARDLSDAKALFAMMIVLLTVGLFVDSLFGAADNALRRRWGLVDTAAA